MSMITPLVEVYQDDSILKQASCYTDVWRYDGSIETGLERSEDLGSLATRAAVIEHVEGLPEDDWNGTRRRAARLLGCLPPHILLYNFGEEVTAWTLANDVSRRSESLRQALEEEGYSSELLEKACLLAWEEHQPPRGRDVLRQNAVMEAILGRRLDTIDLPKVLQGAALPGVTLSDKRSKEYAIIPLKAEEGDVRPGGRVWQWDGKEKTQMPGVGYSIWLDTPTGFALTYKEIPQAVIGVTACGTDGLKIRQMQRVFGRTYDASDPDARYTGVKSPRGLMPLDWQKLMVGVTAEFAGMLGKTEVVITAGKEVSYSRDCHVTAEQAKEMYDVPADRLGFVGDESGDWHQPVAVLLQQLYS